MSKAKPLIIDLKGLRTSIGLKVSRSQLARWMHDPKYAKNRFPRGRKLGCDHRNARLYWLVEEIIEWLRFQGLEVPRDWAP
jgi:predicted DNA-binding transcriptional regulator AlpA